MRRLLGVGALAAATLVVSSALADDAALKSGPPVGKNIPGAFHPFNVTGAQAGKKFCQV
jgi:hypothetical protein